MRLFILRLFAVLVCCALTNQGSLLYGAGQAALLAPTFPTVGSGTLKLRLKADTGNLALTGSNVTQWNDISGNGNNFNQGNASFQPLYTPNVLNGHGVVTFDGSNDRLSVVGAGLNTTNLPLTMFLVTQGTTNPLAVFDSAPTQANVFRFYPANTAEFWTVMPATPLTLHSAGSVVSLSGDLSPGRTMNIHEIFGNNAYNIVTTNGSNATTTQIVFSNPVIGVINNDPNTAVFGGGIAELLIYTGALSNADRLAVEQYLQQEYNIGFVEPTLAPEPGTLLLSAFCSVFLAGQYWLRRRRCAS